MLHSVWLKPFSLLQRTLTTQQHTETMLLEASKRSELNAQRARCLICHQKSGCKRSCDFCMQSYCTLCVEPRKHKCTGSTSQASGASVGRPPFMEPHLEMPIISKAPKWAQFPKHDNEEHKVPPMPQPLLADHSAALPSKKRKTFGIPSATIVAHSKRAGKKREERSGGDEASNWSHQWDSWEQWPTAGAQKEWSSGNWNEYTWDTWIFSPQQDTAPLAKAEHEDHKATDGLQNETKQPSAIDEEGSDIEITAATGRVKKKIFRAVTAAIQLGHALDHCRTTLGLAQIAPSKALSILNTLHTAKPGDPQEYVDSWIEEIIATFGSTQQQALPRPSHAKHQHYTAELISRALVNFIRCPTTRPKGLHIYRHSMLRIQDVMRWWGTSEGLTTTEVIEAIKENTTDQNTNRTRFTLVSEAHRTMLMVHRHPSVGQIQRGAFKPKAKPCKA